MPISNVEAHSLIDAARAALRRGEERVAETLCRQALAANDTDNVAWTLLGTALRSRDPVSAEAALRRAIDGNASNADAHFHLANLLREQRRYHEAVAEYRCALLRLPNHPSLLNNLGLSLAALGADVDAEGAYRRVLAGQPAHRQALANLLHLLCRNHRYEDARIIGDRYLHAHPDGPAEFWIDYGISRHARFDLEGAAACFRRALGLVPNDPTALADLGTVLIDMGDFVAAAPVLAAARAAAPGDLHALSLLAHCRAHLCDWNELASLHASIADGLARDASMGINPFQGLAMPLPAATQQQNARHWAADVKPSWTLAPGIVKEPGNKLRIGYVSSDFREHAVSYLAAEVWERHDRSRVATFGYAIGVPDDSPLRRRIRTAFATFRDCHADSAEDVARRIRADGVDVLVDLNGYTTHARSEIFASRPAPLQVQWLGYLGTMGAPWIDYIATDREATPPAAQRHFDERFLYLPDCYCPSDTRRPVADVPSRGACGLPDRGFVFCCFNNPYKLLPPVFDAWMRILRQTPGSVVWLSPAHSVAMGNLGREAEKRGVHPSRLVFAPRVSIAEHLGRHAHVDLYLDTTPYNAGTAANDALFMGVPVLTCSGDTMASRVAGSQLHAIGMADLVTYDLEAYEQRALALARGPAEGRALKAQLAANRKHFPLFDMARFTHELERALVAAAGGCGRMAG